MKYSDISFVSCSSQFISSFQGQSNLTAERHNSICSRRHSNVNVLKASAQEYNNPSRRSFLKLISSSSILSLISIQQSLADQTISSVYDFAPLKNGKPYPLSDYRGKVTLFVNVASYCALTPQYEGLVKLYEKYHSKGFDIVASPCNQFGRQEPESNSVICEKVKDTFGVNFLLLDKLVVNDSSRFDLTADPLYKYLKDNSKERTSEPVLWNFEKFLVNKNGEVAMRYGPAVYPQDIDQDIKDLLERSSLS